MMLFHRLYSRRFVISVAAVSAGVFFIKRILYCIHEASHIIAQYNTSRAEISSSWEGLKKRTQTLTTQKHFTYYITNPIYYPNVWAAYHLSCYRLILILQASHIYVWEQLIVKGKC